jgi:hypothetical protein|nr:MAG TPA: hypothetical protein [Microviridae sp.]
MYISSVVLVFSSEDDFSMQSVSLCLDSVVGCTYLHAMEYLNKNPVVKSYLRNKYRIINLTFKYSKL